MDGMPNRKYLVVVLPAESLLAMIVKDHQEECHNENCMIPVVKEVNAPIAEDALIVAGNEVSGIHLR